MRDIKFRAWVADGKDYSEMYPNVQNHIGEDFGFGHMLQNTVNGLDCKVMQYTGLKDKNGVEIYEGDICVIYSNKNSPPVCVVGSYTGEVVYLDGAYYLVRDGKKTSTLCVGGYCKKESCQDIEVIGNIYENP